MVKRGEIDCGEIGEFGWAWRQDHGRPVGSEVMGRSYGVCRAAPSLRTQPDELLVASCGLTKTATLTMPSRWWPSVASAAAVIGGQPA